MTPEDMRKERCASLCGVAERVGVSRQTYAKLEKNPDDYSVKQVKGFCEALGVTPGEMMRIFFSELG